MGNYTGVGEFAHDKPKIRPELRKRRVGPWTITEFAPAAPCQAHCPLRRHG